MIIRLKKMIVSIVFGDIQMVFIDIIINFGIYDGFWFPVKWWVSGCCGRDARPCVSTLRKLQ